MMAVVLLACFVSLMTARQALAADRQVKKHDAKKQVEALEEQWRKAQLAGDVTTMDKMLAEDFIGISMSGQVNTKAQQLDRVKTRRLVVTKIQLSDVKVKLVGSVAIVTSQAEVEGTNESEAMHGQYRYTRIYQRLPGGEWKITSFEATRIRPEHNNKNAGQVAPKSSGMRKAAEPRFG
jgi:ketosteroid isomerase-like protein